MKLSGYTPDKSIVVSGVFLFVGTHGLPLEVILEDFKRRNWQVDWDDYIQSAMKDGQKYNNARSKILEAVGDVYGNKFKEQIIIRLDILKQWHDRSI